MNQQPCPIEASVIAPNLWMGSRPPLGAVLRRCGVDIVVLCAYEHQPNLEMFSGVEVARMPLDDSLSIPPADAFAAFQLAIQLAKQLKRGKRILITCSQGRNRSGLVTALTLTQLAGVSGREAVMVVKARRKSPFGEALTNAAFVRALASVPPAAVRGPVTEQAGHAMRFALRAG